MSPLSYGSPQQQTRRGPLRRLRRQMTIPASLRLGTRLKGSKEEQAAEDHGPVCNTAQTHKRSATEGALPVANVSCKPPAADLGSDGESVLLIVRDGKYASKTGQSVAFIVSSPSIHLSAHSDSHQIALVTPSLSTSPSEKLEWQEMANMLLRAEMDWRSTSGRSSPLSPASQYSDQTMLPPLDHPRERPGTFLAPRPAPSTPPKQHAPLGELSAPFPPYRQGSRPPSERTVGSDRTVKASKALRLYTDLVQKPFAAMDTPPRSGKDTIDSSFLDFGNYRTPVSEPSMFSSPQAPLQPPRAPFASPGSSSKLRSILGEGYAQSTDTLRTTASDPRCDRPLPPLPPSESHRRNVSNEETRRANTPVAAPVRVVDLPEPYAAIPVMDRDTDLVSALKTRIQAESSTSREALPDVIHTLSANHAALQSRYASEVRRRRRAMLFTLERVEENDIRHAVRALKCLAKITEALDGTVRELVIARDALAVAEAHSAMGYLLDAVADLPKPQPTKLEQRKHQLSTRRRKRTLRLAKSDSGRSRRASRVPAGGGRGAPERSVETAQHSEPLPIRRTSVLSSRTTGTLLSDLRGMDFPVPPPKRQPSSTAPRISLRPASNHESAPSEIDDDDEDPNYVDLFILPPSAASRGGAAPGEARRETTHFPKSPLSPTGSGNGHAHGYSRTPAFTTGPMRAAWGRAKQQQANNQQATTVQVVVRKRRTIRRRSRHGRE